MTEAERILKESASVLVIDWPSRDVPDSLVRSGRSVHVKGGPGADDYAIHELIDGEVIARRTGGAPTNVDLVYCHRPVAELGTIAALARECGARTVWRQSCTDQTGASDPRGFWVSEEESRRAHMVVGDLGLQLIEAPYIADVARALGPRP